MKLSDQLLEQFHSELFKLKRVYFKNIYQIKTIRSFSGVSMFFSCRFRNKNNNTFILSILIQFKFPSPVVRGSIHLLCPRRIYSKELFQVKHEIQEKNIIFKLLNIEKYKHYYQINGKLPDSVIGKAFDKYVKEKLVSYIDIIEEEKYVW